MRVRELNRAMLYADEIERCLVIIRPYKGSMSYSQKKRVVVWSSLGHTRFHEL